MQSKGAKTEVQSNSSSSDCKRQKLSHTDLGRQPPTVKQSGVSQSISPNGIAASSSRDRNLQVSNESHFNEAGSTFCADEFARTPKSRKSCLVVEIFSGTCRLSKACKDVGFRVSAVDKDKNRSENFNIYNCDVGDPKQLKLLKEFLQAESDELLHVHFAPSCGTASRAREKPIPGIPWHKQPKPLRSDEFPDGIPGIQPRDAERVQLANVSYDATMDLVIFLASIGVSSSIENPSNSLFWKYSSVVRAMQSVSGHFTYFDSCMHGGARDKSTAWWSHDPSAVNVNIFEALQAQCDRSHQHAAWKPVLRHGRTHFPTSEEAAYPPVLCQRVAHILKRLAISKGFVFPDDLKHQLAHDDTVGKRQLFATQTRHQHLKPLVSEFSSYQPFILNLADSSDLEALMADLPKGARVCNRRILDGGFSRDDMTSKFPNAVFSSKWDCESSSEVIHVGLPKEPTVFVADAVKAGHPRDMLARAPREVSRLLDSFVNEPHCQRLDRRAKFFKKWLKRSIELKKDEELLHSGLQSHLQPLLAGKRLLLWKEMLVDLAYPDVAIIDEVIRGFPLTGWSKKTGIFQPNVRRPDYGLEQLIKSSKGLNEAVLKSLANESWTDVDQKVWEETLQEVDRRWIREAPNLDFEFVAKRFGLVQKSKVRMIDDFSICGVNGTVGLAEKLRVQSVDELASYLAIIMNISGFSSTLKVVGRTYDLKAAYKQFGVDQFHSDHCRVGVKCPGGGVKKFSVNALPFGATGSVAAFLRIAASVSYIATVGLEIILTNFFDDFTVVCEEKEIESVDFYLTGLFKILGLDYAAEGDKAPPFSAEFGSLGILFNLSSYSSGSFSLEHTEKRKRELLESIDEILGATICGVKELEKLHGRLVWFGSFVFGRQMNVALRILNRFAHSKSKAVSLTEELVDVLKVIRTRLSSSNPTRIFKSVAKTWIIFTDGAYEPSSDTPATVGGVLISPEGEVVQFFGETVSSSLLDELQQQSEHPIYELEVLPVVIATLVWADFIAQSQVVYYLDNEAAKSAFIQGVGFTDSARKLTTIFDEMENRLSIITWFGRVASHSNPADSPSRLCFDDDILLNATRIPVVIPHHIAELGMASGDADS